MFLLLLLQAVGLLVLVVPAVHSVAVGGVVRVKLEFSLGQEYFYTVRGRHRRYRCLQIYYCYIIYGFNKKGQECKW